MKRWQIALVILVSIATFCLVYSPHLVYDFSFPFHIDEWHHITEAEKIREGNYSGGSIGLRIGLHLVLFVLSFLFNLVSIYQFLPGVWAAITALVVFFVIFKKTENFALGILSMVFFASIKSNVNLTGLWFFTSLSFSIPFIFLYIFYFTEGIEKQSRKLLLISFILMLILIFVHSISFLFSVPVLIVYSLFHLGYIKKEFRFFLIFLLLPVIGLLFYKFMLNIPFSLLWANITDALKFKYGWGILELNNSFLEIYSPMGYVLSFIGATSIFLLFKNPKKYLVFIIWPAWVLLDLYLYKAMDFSYLAPFQRNFYYLALSLPILSAIGLYSIYLGFKASTSRFNFKGWKKIELAIVAIMLLIVIFLSFKSYYYIPDQVELYKLINNNDYNALLYLSTLPKSTVMASLDVSTAFYPISGQNPVATISFYGDRKDVSDFFSGDCQEKKRIIDKYDAKYVLSDEEISCNWSLIYNKGDFIYRT